MKRGASYNRCVAPKPPLWSAITRKSSGRSSFAFNPHVDVTSSPRAKRSASSGPSLTPKPKASIEFEVCKWVSPHNSFDATPLVTSASPASCTAAALLARRLSRNCPQPQYSPAPTAITATVPNAILRNDAILNSPSQQKLRFCGADVNNFGIGNRCLYVKQRLPLLHALMSGSRCSQRPPANTMF